MKGKMNYKIRLERMPNERIAKKVYEWNVSKSRWGRVDVLIIDPLSIIGHFSIKLLLGQGCPTCGLQAALRPT